MAFQDLPEANYPRSYTPRMQDYMKNVASTQTGGLYPNATQTAEKAIATKSALPMQFKNGGNVRKTGMPKVHKGERVLTRKQTKSYGRSAHR